MENNKKAVKLIPLTDKEGNFEIVGEVVIMEAVDAKTNEHLGMVARLGLADILSEVLDTDPASKERFVNCSNELSDVIREMFAKLPDIDAETK